MQLHGLGGWRPLNGRPGLRMAGWSLYAGAACDMNSAAAAAVCGLWRYTSVICLMPLSILWITFDCHAQTTEHQNHITKRSSSRAICRTLHNAVTCKDLCNAKYAFFFVQL